MELTDFKIGEIFWTATGQWLCTDVGTRVIVARKGDWMEGWSDVEEVFDIYDFGGCDKENRFS